MARLMYVDDSLVVAEKAPGVAVQARAEAGLERTLAAVVGHSLHAVHRIDQPVGGLVLFAGDGPTAGQLQRQLRDGQVRRCYVAVCEAKQGERLPDVLTMEHIIQFDRRRNRSQVAVNESAGDRARSFLYRAGATERYEVAVLVLDTGRHHQLRVQLSHVGFPVVGDLKYGARRSRRGGGIYLHAAGLAFNHPDHFQRLHLVSPPPPDPLWRAAWEIARELVHERVRSEVAF